MGDYLPRRDAELLAWVTNFNTLISASPDKYGLSNGQAADFNTRVTAFTDAYAATQGPTRGPAATVTKNDAKEAMIDGIGGIRNLVNIIQQFAGTTNAMRVELNITVRDTEPTPVPPPTLSPEMDIRSVSGKSVSIRLHNQEVLQRKKPEGVKGASVFSYIGDSPPAQMSHWKFEFSTTKTNFKVDFPADTPPGSTVWLTAFWFNPTMASGPACTPESTQLQFGGVSMTSKVTLTKRQAA